MILIRCSFGDRGVSLPLMTQALACFLLLSGTVCAGQSVLTTPRDSTQSQPGSLTTPSDNDARFPHQAASRIEDRKNADAEAPASNVTESAQKANAPQASRIVGPLTTRSDFQLFAEDAVGHPLTVFGRQLFDEVPSSFAPVENVPVPADYVVGPGDELLIRAWGKIDLNSRVTVDRNGQVYLPRVGALNVAGLRYEQLDGYLHSAISALFKDFELNVALGRLRSIQIFVLGNARQPGAYTLGSFSTLVDALFASGGPSATGTMRRIELRRSGRLLTEFDIYDLAQKGDKSHDVQLLPGDVIYIPTVGAQVALTGSISQPGIYELKGETTVTAALAGAGGLTSLAEAKRVLLERIDNHSSRRVEEFPLDAQGLQRQLADGDLLRIYPLSPKFENAVTLRGNVAQPGRYAWKEGMKISDLIPSREFLVTRDFWNGQNQLVPARVEQAFQTQRSAEPAAQHPEPLVNQRTGQTEDPPANQSATSPRPMIESVGHNSAEINWAYAVIERLDDQDLSTRLIPFRLASALDDRSSSDNQPLKAGDVVTIFSRADLELPMEKHSAFVRVGGEVTAPGVYRVDPGDTLRDVVVRAGGLTSHSYLYASFFTRVSTRKAQEAQLRQFAEKTQNELASRYANALPQAGQTPAEQQAQLALQQAAVARLASIRPIGRVVLDLKPDAATAQDIPDFPLEDGDTFYIPPKLSTVQVAGAVYNANAFRHQQGKRLTNYLNDAGGATREADQKRIFVIRADGTVVSRQGRNHHIHTDFQKIRLLPGDAIVVPEKVRASSALAGVLQYTQLASQLALTAAALSVVH